MSWAAVNQERREGMVGKGASMPKVGSGMGAIARRISAKGTGYKK